MAFESNNLASINTTVLLPIKNKHVSFVLSKKERDAPAPIYSQAAAPGHILEIVRLVLNFYMSDFLHAVDIIACGQCIVRVVLE